MITNDGFCLEVLEFSRIRTSFCRHINQILTTLEVAIMIGSNIGDKKCWVLTPNFSALDFKDWQWCGHDGIHEI